MKTIKSTLFKTIKGLANSEGKTQQQVSDSIKRHNSYFWNALKRDWVRFEHLKQACGSLDSEIVLRSRTGRKLEYTLGETKKRSLEVAMMHFTLDQDETQQSVAQAVKRDNAHLWATIQEETVRYQFLIHVCEYLSVDMIIKTKNENREFILNPETI